MYIYIYILYAFRDSADATKAWRLEAWCKECEVPPFGVIGGLCGVLGDPLVCLGVPGGSLPAKLGEGPIFVGNTCRTL